MDIVERLNDDSQCFCSIRKEAADEIERLREALNKMQRSRDRYRQAWEAEKARFALQNDSPKPISGTYGKEPE